MAPQARTKADARTDGQGRPVIASPRYAPATLDVARAVTELYSSVATAPSSDLHFPVGRKAAEHVGYEAYDLDLLPPAALESFAGVGNPFKVGAIQRGDTVVDIGSGSGTDLLIAAHRVGPEGRVFGIDITEAMMAKALANAEAIGAHNAFVLSADAGTRIPLPSRSVDVVTSNGVVNLIPDKLRAFEEAHRILKPGGRLQLADIVVNVAIPESARADETLWAACIAGADLHGQYLETIRKAGFQDVQVVDRLDYFAAAPREDARVTAAGFEAEALVISARKQ